MTQTKATRPRTVVPRHTPSVSTPRTMAAAVGALFVVAGWIGVTSALLARPSSWPALVAIAAAWMQDASTDREWIVRHALRSSVQKGTNRISAP